MVPSLIILAAQQAGLDIIGIADHNSCQNAGAVIEASKGSSVKVLPGMEVQSVEGVHLLCLFDTLEAAGILQEAVYASLPNVPGAKKVVDQQFIVDSQDEFIEFCEKPISLPTMMEIDEIYERTYALEGILIPSHIDRYGTGMCGVLGMLPESPVFEAVEISANMTVEQAKQQYPGIGEMPVFRSSDAHWLSAIGERRTTLYMEHRNVNEIRRACRREGGRRVGDA
jgi:PHP family Zn ribbon phosphoesterase